MLGVHVFAVEPPFACPIPDGIVALPVARYAAILRHGIGDQSQPSAGTFCVHIVACPVRSDHDAIPVKLLGTAHLVNLDFLGIGLLGSPDPKAAVFAENHRSIVTSMNGNRRTDCRKY